MDTEFGAFGPHFRVDLGRFWGRFGGSGGTIWEVGGELGHMYVKKGGGVFLNHPFWAGGGSFGHEKWARELARRCPEDPKIGRSSPEERAKRLCEEKIMKTSKTSTLSSEMRGFGGREGPKILKNRPRSGLEGLKSSIVT